MCVFCKTYAYEGSWQEQEHTSARLIASGNNLAIELLPKTGAHVYAHDIADVGRAPSIFLTSNNIDNYKIYYPSYMTENRNGMKVNFYNGLVYFPIIYDITDKKNQVTIEIHADFTVCSDSCSIEKYKFYLNTTNFQEDKFIENLITKQISKSAKFSVNINEITENEPGQNLNIILMYAIIGGLLLNFMPCVLPIVSLKLLSFSKLSRKENFRFSVFSLILGIIFSFQMFAVLVVVLRFSGEYVGFGFQFQNNNFLIAIYLLLFLIAICVKNNITITLPSFINNFANKKPLSLLKYLDSFLMGILTTILATPCTAPYLFLATGYAITGSVLEILAIFFTISVGLSVPYILFLIFPNIILKFLPKSGVWMNYLKKTISILIFISSIWILYIISQKIGIWPALLILLISLLVKFAIEEKTVFYKYDMIRKLFLLLACSAIFILPKQLYLKNQYQEEITEGFWQDFSLEKLNKYRNENREVIVDISADWCLSCKINKFLVLDNKNVVANLERRNMIGLRFDISGNAPPEIINFMNKFKRNDIPFTVIFTNDYPNGKLLPILLSVDDVEQE